MAMKNCKDCGSEISSKAKTCPKCGLKQKKFGLRITLGIIILIIGIALLVGDTSNVGTITQTGSDIVEEKMTLEKFNKIQTGMTYEEVVEIAGEEGTLSTESVYGNQSMKIYYWYSYNGISNATVSFMNGKVTGKSQIGLE